MENNIVNKKRVLMATGQSALDNMSEYLTDSYEVVAITEYKVDLEETVENKNPDILVAGTLLGGNEPLIPILMKLKITHPNLRIILLIPEVDVTDAVYVTSLGHLATLGVYDIIEGDEMTPNTLLYVLNTPAKEDNVVRYLNLTSDSSYGNKKSGIDVILPNENEDSAVNLRSNLVSFISSKGGTGKSTILSNVALAISKMGVKTEEGFKPKVLILDLDFYQFTVTRMFSASKEDKNIFNALSKIKENMNKGTIEGPKLPETIAFIEEQIVNIMGKGISILGGTDEHFSLDRIENITQEEVLTLVGILTDLYDIILIDTGNDPTNKYTSSVLTVTQFNYYIMDMNFLSFMQEQSFQPLYEEQGIASKSIYVLNKYLDTDNVLFSRQQVEEVGYKLKHVVSLYDPVSMLNDSYEGKFLMEDTSKDTEQIRFEIIEIANSIWGINNFESLRKAIKGEEVKIVKEKVDKTKKTKKSKNTKKTKTKDKTKPKTKKKETEEKTVEAEDILSLDFKEELERKLRESTISTDEDIEEPIDLEEYEDDEEDSEEGILSKLKGKLFG